MTAVRRTQSKLTTMVAVSISTLIAVIIFFGEGPTGLLASNPADGNGSGAVITIPVIAIGDAPAIDGACDADEYDTAAVVTYRDESGETERVYLLRTAHNLYVCFSPVQFPYNGSDLSFGVYIDTDNDGDDPDEYDFAVIQPSTSAAHAGYWNQGSGDFSGADPGGWLAAGKTGSCLDAPCGRWRSAEFKLSRTSLSGWRNTVGIALLLKRETTNSNSWYGWPSADISANPRQWGNAHLPTGSIVINRSDLVPVVDGYCDVDTEWIDATRIEYPVGTGFTGTALAKLSDTDLYVCQILREPSSATADGPNAAIYINRLNTGGESTTSDDMRFTISYNGAVRAGSGDGTGWTGPDPGGHTIVRQIYADKWHAEYRISGETIGGTDWNREINIAFVQQWVSNTGDDYGWPPAWRWNVPSTWGVAHFQSEPPVYTIYIPLIRTD